MDEQINLNFFRAVGEFLNLLFKGSLSSRSLPKWINRMLLGLAGLPSHSSRHSLNINSFNLYTLTLKGSLFPFSVTSGTSTFRLAKYLKIKWISDEVKRPKRRSGANVIFTGHRA